MPHGLACEHDNVIERQSAHHFIWITSLNDLHEAINALYLFLIELLHLFSSNAWVNRGWFRAIVAEPNLVG
jgi:hypothetical protein